MSPTRASRTRAASTPRAAAASTARKLELPPPELVVVTHKEARVRATREGIVAFAPDAGRTADLLQEYDARLHPLFGVREDRLERAAAAPSATGVALPDLSVYYRLEAPAAQLPKIAKEIAGLSYVAAAYLKPPAEPADLNDMAPSAELPPTTTPDFTSRQIYLDAAPAGVDARWAWTQSGGSGAGVRIIDVEGAWRFSHEDLLQNQGGVIGGTQSTDIGWRNHGTAVVGEFGGDRNTFGITGICPDANVRAVSIFGGTGSGGAVRLAADALSAGDVILIELHRPGPRHAFAGRADQLGYIAIEWWPDDFDAIRYAIGRGVIVVEAGGNGAENLDDALYSTPAAGFPASWSNPFNRSNRDSGAIVVGAGAPPPGTHGRDHGPDRSRLDFSNFGSVIDAQGWGREVTSTGYGDLQGGTNEDEWYTDQFSGTSSASPIVTGVVAAFQGIARARGQVLTSQQVRQHLRATGSPQTDAPGRPATQRIGNRPDLRALVAAAFKSLKSEIKEGKREKLELKELKREKLEIKEGKREKLEIKEKLEQFEKQRFKEFKEIKPEIEGRFNRKDLVEQRQFQQWQDVFGGQGQGQGPGVAGSAADMGLEPSPEGVDERLARLEATVGELLHFIGADLRPDLGAGALSQEQDLMGKDVNEVDPGY